MSQYVFALFSGCIYRKDLTTSLIYHFHASHGWILFRVTPQCPLPWYKLTDFIDKCAESEPPLFQEFLKQNV